MKKSSLYRGPGVLNLLASIQYSRVRNRKRLGLRNTGEDGLIMSQAVGKWDCRGKLANSATFANEDIDYFTKWASLWINWDHSKSSMQNSIKYLLLD